MSVIDREQLGQLVRQIWIECAREQSDPKPHHLLSWEELDEWNKEVDRRIGERVAQVVMELQGREYIWALRNARLILRSADPIKDQSCTPLETAVLQALAVIDLALKEPELKTLDTRLLLEGGTTITWSGTVPDGTSVEVIESGRSKQDEQ